MSCYGGAIIIGYMKAYTLYIKLQDRLALHGLT